MGIEAEGNLTVGGQKVPVRADFGSDSVLFSGGRRGKVPYRSLEVVSVNKGWLKLRVDGNPMEFDLGQRAQRIADKIRKPPSRLDKLGIRPGAIVHVDGIDDKSFLREVDAMTSAAVPAGTTGAQAAEGARPKGPTLSSKPHVPTVRQPTPKRTSSGSATAGPATSSATGSSSPGAGSGGAFTPGLSPSGRPTRHKGPSGGPLTFLGIHDAEELDRIAMAAADIPDDGALWVVFKKGNKGPGELNVIEAGRAAGLKDIKVVRFNETHTALKFVVPIIERVPFSNEEE